MIIIITSYVSVYILIAIMFLFFFGIHAMCGLYTEPHVSVAGHYYSETNQEFIWFPLIIFVILAVVCWFELVLSLCGS